ncbi:MAG: geranylgeranyl reductase family protein [Chthoniobacterales bacterium]
MNFDVLIVGAGPAGSVAAAHLARAGRRVIVLEKTKFPRHKVCGDCLNPLVWPLLTRLDLHERILTLPHARADAVEFLGADGQRVHVPSPSTPHGELMIARRDLDTLLIDRATALGADFRDGITVTRVERHADRWTLHTSDGEFRAPTVLAADGRNSTIARQTDRLGRTKPDRVAIQTHAPLAPDLGNTIRMIFHADGYGGLARIGDSTMNVCLVARAPRLPYLRAFAETEFGLPPTTTWRSITPLTRADSAPLAADGLYLLGDAARVVEPFTGEGITYAMRSGELAANALVHSPTPEADYRRAHRAMYRGRLWVNQLARQASLHPRFSSKLLRLLPLNALTAKVVTS